MKASEKIGGVLTPAPLPGAAPLSPYLQAVLAAKSGAKTVSHENGNAIALERLFKGRQKP
jgi:hypothetical protein